MGIITAVKKMFGISSNNNAGVKKTFRFDESTRASIVLIITQLQKLKGDLEKRGVNDPDIKICLGEILESLKYIKDETTPGSGWDEGSFTELGANYKNVHLKLSYLESLMEKLLKNKKKDSLLDDLATIKKNLAALKLSYKAKK